jgi:hypothetical protein
MADCHKQFGEFHGKIELIDSSRAKLEQGRNAIRDLIRADFKEKGRTPVPSFEEQGSWAMGTIINPLPGEEFDWMTAFTSKTSTRNPKRIGQRQKLSTLDCRCR